MNDDKDSLCLKGQESKLLTVVRWQKPPTAALQNGSLQILRQVSVRVGDYEFTVYIMQNSCPLIYKVTSQTRIL